ncbi:MAG: hypothetical protein U0793_07420 [Gemmataceae bacterium]
MYTSVGLLALAASFSNSALPTERLWQRDYTKAQQQAAAEKKPLLVVVGSGQEGFEKLAQDGKLGDDVARLLSESYVCCYLDTEKSSQAKVIGDLSVKSGHGMIISDRKGEVMAFHHDGKLTQADLQSHLKHFANPALEIRTTLTNSSTRYSMYPSSNGFGAAPGYGYGYAAPAMRSGSC